MTTIAFIRHGMTDWNKERRAQGQSDIPLNETGRAEAHALAERLSAESWDLVYASDLSRARETAEIAAARMGVPVRLDARLREMYKGETEGTTPEERVQRWGQGWAELDLGIEPEASIIRRGAEFVADLLRLYPDKRILAVSHGALIGLTVKQLAPQADTVQHYHNTSMTVLHFNGAVWECELLNCAKHLP